MERNLVLTGFMGTGKTTVGRHLADRLGRDFVDTDEVIAERHGAIEEIFADEGEAAFRAMERELAAELAERAGLVIATGGRMMLDPANLATLGATGRTYCLVASPETIYFRAIREDNAAARPLLDVADPRARIAELLEAREPHYRRFPRIATDGGPAEEMAESLAGLFTAGEARIDVPGGTYEVGTGILAAATPEVKPRALVADPRAAHLYAPLVGPAELTVTIPPGTGHQMRRDLRSLQARAGSRGSVVAIGPQSIASATANLIAEVTYCPTELAAMLGAARALPASRVIADVATLQTEDPHTFSTALAELAAAASGTEDFEIPTTWHSGVPLSATALLALQSLVAGAVAAIMKTDPGTTSPTGSSKAHD